MNWRTWKPSQFLSGYLALLFTLTACGSVTPVPETKDVGKIVFISDRDGNNEIYIMNTDGSEQTNLTNNPAQDWFPTISPDGKQIAFASDREGQVSITDRAIFVMNMNGSNQFRVSEKGGGFPAWSPDGAKIAYGCYLDGNDDVCIMNADGSEQTRLIIDPAKDGCPAWSPDGSRILFASDRTGLVQLFLVNPDGSSLVQLTNGPEHGCGSWSPDGSRIIYAAPESDGHYEIYVMKTDSSNQIRLTSGTANNSSPIWIP